METGARVASDPKTPPNRVTGCPPPPGGVTTGGTDWAEMSRISRPPAGRYTSRTRLSHAAMIGRSADDHRNSTAAVVVVTGRVMGVTSWEPLRVMVTLMFPAGVPLVPHRVTSRSWPLARSSGGSPTRIRTSPPVTAGVAVTPVSCWSERACTMLVPPVDAHVPTVWMRLVGRTVMAGAGGCSGSPPPGSGSGVGVTVPGSVTTICPVRTSTHVFDWVPPVVTPVQIRKIPAEMCTSPTARPFPAVGTGRPDCPMKTRMPPPAGRSGLGHVPSVPCRDEVTSAPGSVPVPPPPVGSTLASSVRVREFWAAMRAATVVSTFSSVTASMSIGFLLFLAGG